jgi:hypothetical protein
MYLPERHSPSSGANDAIADHYTHIFISLSSFSSVSDLEDLTTTLFLSLLSQPKSQLLTLFILNHLPCVPNRTHHTSYLHTYLARIVLFYHG